jgi:hypothetical protein
MEILLMRFRSCTEKHNISSSATGIWQSRPKHGGAGRLAHKTIPSTTFRLIALAIMVSIGTRVIFLAETQIYIGMLILVLFLLVLAVVFLSVRIYQLSIVIRCRVRC